MYSEVSNSLKLSYLHDLDFSFFICDFIDIDKCKGNHSCHEDATIISLDILEMDKIAQVNSE